MGGGGGGGRWVCYQRSWSQRGFILYILVIKIQLFAQYFLNSFFCNPISLMRVCVCARAWMDACSEHYSCVCGCMSVEEAGAGERGENVSEIFTYLFYIYCYFKCTFLSPCVKGIFLCFVY